MKRLERVRSSLGVFCAQCSPVWRTPHYYVKSFKELALPLSQCLRYRDGSHPEIRTVILDKDQCFAYKDKNVVIEEFKPKFNSLRLQFNGFDTLVVSNSSGLLSKDGNGTLAALLQENTGVDVFKHESRKPYCWRSLLHQILRNKQYSASHPSHIAIIGDNPYIDNVMANLMGSWAIQVGPALRPMDENAGAITKTKRRLLESLFMPNRMVLRAAAAGDGYSDGGLIPEKPRSDGENR